MPDWTIPNSLTESGKRRGVHYGVVNKGEVCSLRSGQRSGTLVSLPSPRTSTTTTSFPTSDLLRTRLKGPHESIVARQMSPLTTSCPTRHRLRPKLCPWFRILPRHSHDWRSFGNILLGCLLADIGDENRSGFESRTCVFNAVVSLL